MKYKFIIIIAVLLLICISIPTWLWIRDYVLNQNHKIESATLAEYGTFQTFILSFWGLILNIILVIIAYKAFQNFDVKKQFHNKQLEIVSELATSINSTEISNMLYETVKDPAGVEHKILTGYDLSFFAIAIGFDYTKFESIYVRGNNMELLFPFLKFRNHPLLPKKIANVLNKLYRPLQYRLSVKEDELPKNYVELYKKHKVSDDIFSKFKYEFYKNPSEFRVDCINLRKEIIEWYKEYGAEDLNI